MIEKGNNVVNIDESGLEKEVAKLKLRSRNIHAIKVSHKGETLLSKGYNGYNKDEIHKVFSCTKTILALLIGIAVENGFIKSENEKVVNLLAKYSKHFEGDKSSMTLKDLLSMRSGIEWDEFNDFAKKNGIWKKFLSSDDSAEYVLTRPMQEKPDTSFNYNSGVSHLLSVIIETNSGLSTYEFAKKYLFGPLDIEESNMKWEVDKKGIVYGGHGLSMKLDDLEKIGILCVQNGIYNNSRIISEKWINDSILPHSKNTRGYAGYGYQLWKGIIKEKEFYGAFGHAGQRIYMFKDLGLVVTFLGNVKPEFGIQEKLIREFVFSK